MSGWYRRFGANFIAGTLDLTFEEKGAYSLCLDLIYDRGAPIPDDPRWIAGVCGISMRRWNGLRDALIAKGKLYLIDGKLSNKRADKEMQRASDIHGKRVDAARLGADATNKKDAKTAGKPAENAAKNARKPSENQAVAHEINGLEAPNGHIRARRIEDRIEEEPYHTAQPYLGTAPENDATPARAVPRQGREFYDHVENRLRDSVPWSNSPDIGLKDLSPILALLGGGMDLELDVVPAITAAARKDPTPRRTWKYFIGHISEWHVLRTKPPDVVVPFAKPETERERKDRETREFIHETKQAAPCSMSISTSSSH